MDQKPIVKATTRTNIRASIRISTKRKNIQAIMPQEIGGSMEGCLILRLYTQIPTILLPIMVIVIVHTEAAVSFV